MLIHTWWEEWEEAKGAKTDRGRFTSSGLDVIWQSSILVNKWWGQGLETEKRSKTLINYFYLLNETTLILVSRSGRKRADLSSAFNIVGISLITRSTESWFSLHRKPIVHPNHLSQWFGRCTPGLVGNLVLVDNVPETSMCHNKPEEREDQEVHIWASWLGVNNTSGKFYQWIVRGLLRGVDMFSYMIHVITLTICRSSWTFFSLTY